MGGTNKCPVCSATFTRSQHVARHMRSHTGDRPYPCPWCPEKFARSDLLARHKKKFHPDGPNSAPPPPKYSRQPKPAAAAAAAAAGGAGAVAGPSTGKGKARADSTAEGVAQLSLSDNYPHPADGSSSSSALANGLRHGSYAGLTSAGPFGSYTFGSLPAFPDGSVPGGPPGEPLVVGATGAPHPSLLPAATQPGYAAAPPRAVDYSAAHGQPQQQQQQHVPQPSYQAYDRRFSLPGALGYTPCAQSQQPQQQYHPQHQQQQAAYRARQAYVANPQQQQQQIYAQPLPPGASGSSLYALGPTGAVSSRGSSASSSEYGAGPADHGRQQQQQQQQQRLGPPPVSVTPYASSSSSTGGHPSAFAPPQAITTSVNASGSGLIDSPVGVSPAESGSTFASSARSGSQQTSPLPPPQQQQGWYQPGGGPSYAPPQPQQRQQYQQQQPYYTSPLAGTLDGLSGQMLPPQQPQQQYTLDPASYVPHLLIGADDSAVDGTSPAGGQSSGVGGTAAGLPAGGESGSDGGPNSPLALAGWSGIDWTTPVFNSDSPVPSPGLFGAGRAVKPSLNPLQAPTSASGVSAHLGFMTDPHQPQSGAHYPAYLQQQQQQQPQKIPSLEDVKDIWRYFLSPALPTPAAQPFGGLAPPLDDGTLAVDGGQVLDGGANGQAIPSGSQQPQQQQPFATDEAQARSFEDAIRSRPTMQLQPPTGPMRPARSTTGSSPASGGYDGQQQQQLQQQQQQQQQQAYIRAPPAGHHPHPQHPSHPQQHQQAGPYYSTWPPPTLAPADARGLLSSTLAAGGSVGGLAPGGGGGGVKREFSSVDLGTPRSAGGGGGGGYASYFSPPTGGGGGGVGGRPKMPRLRSGSVGRVPEGQVWEGFLEGYRGASLGFGGGEGVFPSA